MGVPDLSYPTDEEDWSGCLTLPRELTVRKRRLVQQPLPELKKLRDERLSTQPDEQGVFALPKAAEIELEAGSFLSVSLCESRRKRRSHNQL